MDVDSVCRHCGVSFSPGIRQKYDGRRKLTGPSLQTYSSLGFVNDRPEEVLFLCLKCNRAFEGLTKHLDILNVRHHEDGRRQILNDESETRPRKRKRGEEMTVVSKLNFQ